MKIALLAITAITCCAISSSAQDQPKIKFGAVTAQDLSRKIYSVDSSAEAVIIADIGTSQIVGNNKGWFSIEHKHYRRAHILSKNAFDIANVSILLYTDGSAEESLEKLKAVTYNLEDGKVVESRLDTKGGVFKDKLDKYFTVRKFTMPNVKEGSIIEYEYTTTSEFLGNMPDWSFQGGYPRLWSEYNLTMPEFFRYAFLTQGYKKYDISDKKDRRETFTVSDITNVGASGREQFSANVSDYRWVMKDVPVLKEEAFTSSIENHVAKLDFQLVEKKFPLQYKMYMGSWQNVANNLLQSEYFGDQLNKDNPWLKEVLAELKGDNADKLTLAKRIYGWVRDNITCTDKTALFMQQPLKNVLKTKSGNVAEVNLLLTAMLVHEDIAAFPVILSTRSHGFAYSMYPVLSQYNYVVSRAMIGDKVIYLDASEPGMGFGHLPLRCYNGAARVIDKEATQVELLPDEILENQTVSLFIINDEKGKMVGSVQEMAGYHESLDMRDEVKQKGKDKVLADLQQSFGADIKVSNLVIDSLRMLEEPLYLKYDIDFNGEKEDIIYFNPLLAFARKENPFKSAVRAYPVEMPYTMDYAYTLQMEVPAGYVVDELPQSVVVKLNEANEGIFEYRISQSGSNISFRTRVQIARAYFLPEEYDMLREFFNLIVKKHGEQIVFKKKP